MTNSERKRLISEASEFKGKRRTRFVSEVEIQIMLELDRKTSLKGKKIRVYSNDGFVPNSYFGSPRIDYIERWYDDDGKKHFNVSQTSASRSYGEGSMVTVDGRGYKNY